MQRTEATLVLSHRKEEFPLGRCSEQYKIEWRQLSLVAVSGGDLQTRKTKNMVEVMTFMHISGEQNHR